MSPSQPAPSRFHLSWGRAARTGRLPALPSGSAWPPPSTSACAAGNAHSPSGESGYGRDRPGGNPGSARISSAETSFSEHALGTRHEVVRYFTAPVTPMGTGALGREGISMPSLASADAGRHFQSRNSEADQP